MKKAESTDEFKSLDELEMRMFEPTPEERERDILAEALKTIVRANSQRGIPDYQYAVRIAEEALAKINR